MCGHGCFGQTADGWITRWRTWNNELNSKQERTECAILKQGLVSQNDFFSDRTPVLTNSEYIPSGCHCGLVNMEAGGTPSFFAQDTSKPPHRNCMAQGWGEEEECQVGEMLQGSGKGFWFDRLCRTEPSSKEGRMKHCFPCLFFVSFSFQILGQILLVVEYTKTQVGWDLGVGDLDMVQTGRANWACNLLTCRGRWGILDTYPIG